MSDHEGDARNGRGPGVAGPPREVIEALPELNEFCFQVLAEQARAGSPHRAAQQIAEGWLALDGPARRRAAAHPYLLFDAGFADPHRWQNLDLACQVNDPPPEAAYERVFTVTRAVTATELVFVYAWSLARRHAVQARLVLGMHPLCAEWIAAHSVLGAHQLGSRLWPWLRPRWLNTPELWAELLQGAAEGGAAHQRARLQGMRLLAAETATALRHSGHDAL